MEKEEVLAMSRKEKNDEGLVAAENQGRKVGFLAFCALFIVIIFFNLFSSDHQLHGVLLLSFRQSLLAGHLHS